MSEWIEKIKRNNLFHFAQPADICKIKDAENLLCVKFADDYTKFLQNIGACICFGHEINGLTEKSNLNIIKSTEEQRKLNLSVPSTWYAIEDTHIDGIIIWQDQSGSIYQISPGNLPIKIATGIVQYLNL